MVVVVAVTLALAAAGPPASARTLVPALGLWSGGGGSGGHVGFVVSRVGGMTVPSDLVVHCTTAFGAASDDDPYHVRHEAAIGSDGRIYEHAAPFARD